MLTIEQNPSKTFFEEFFYNCKTISLKSMSGNERRFVVEACSNNNQHRYETDTEIAVKKIIEQLLIEGDNQYFLSNDDSEGKKMIIVRGNPYYLDYSDRTETWPNHGFYKVRNTIVGFKPVSKKYI